MSQKLISLERVKCLTTLSRSRIYFLIKRNEFPSQIQIGTRRVAWIESEVQDWINHKIKNRRDVGDAF